MGDRELYSCTAVVHSLGCLYNVRIPGINAPSLTMIKTSENMTSLVESDTEPLFGGKEKRKCSGRCWVISSVCIAVSVGLIFLGYNFYWKDVVGLRVMTYNTWGIPHTFGSKDKEERMEKIGHLLSRGDYDLVLLEELWMRPDHETIKSSLGPELYMTEYDDLNKCQGTIWPWGCSGLAIISRFPILERNFTQFTDQGPFSHIFSDGEYFSGKGVGRVAISPKEGIEVDVFVTHTISEDSNYEIREKQVDELIGLVEVSKADFIILGGDFNASPMMELDKTYNKVKKVMTDTFQEIMDNIKAWLNEEFATFANPRNTYTGNSAKSGLKPVIYDYIFHKKNTLTPAMIWTNWFYLPFLKAFSNYNNNTISLSDHEAVTTHIYLWKQDQDRTTL